MSGTKNVSGSNFISEEAYREIKAKTVVVCTDGIILRGNGSVLLGIREIEPVKGLPWIIGGRVPKESSMSVAVGKKVLQETGLETVDAGLVGVYRRVYKTGEDRDDLIHTHLAIEIGGNIKPDFQNKTFVEVSGYGKEFDKLHDRVRQPIIDSELFEDNSRIANALTGKLRELNGIATAAQIGSILREDYAALRKGHPKFYDDVTPL